MWCVQSSSWVLPAEWCRFLTVVVLSCLVYTVTMTVTRCWEEGNYDYSRTSRSCCATIMMSISLSVCLSVHLSPVSTVNLYSAEDHSFGIGFYRVVCLRLSCGFWEMVQKNSSCCWAFLCSFSTVQAALLKQKNSRRNQQTVVLI